MGVDLDAVRVSAYFALVTYCILISDTFDSERLHRAEASRCAVAGIYINMHTPQACGTMIGVAISRDHRATLGACEIFDASLELFCCHFRGVRLRDYPNIRVRRFRRKILV